jgi:hypothetical protein
MCKQLLLRGKCCIIISSAEPALACDRRKNAEPAALQGHVQTAGLCLAKLFVTVALLQILQLALGLLAMT